MKKLTSMVLLKGKEKYLLPFKATLNMSLCRTSRSLNFCLMNLKIKGVAQRTLFLRRFPMRFDSYGFLNCNIKGFHSSYMNRDLMEFFDEKENWGEREVRVGRSWKVEELRIKSNSDLHKLWYVLLKERNMLLTMQHEYNAKFEPFPNPERLDKVEESMENLECVVRERNRAYFELETGENGERPKVEKTNCFGLTYMHKMQEHVIEKRFNTKYLENEKLYNKTNDHKYVNNFLTRLKEKQLNKDLNKRSYNYRKVCALLERFPNIDEDALQNEYPEVDIEKAKRDKASRGHRENKY